MMLVNGVNTMLKVAAKLLLPQGSVDDKHKRLRFKDGGGDDDQNA
jgi:hypothetical protein